jgi:tRNA threonylcarbamoyladenosine biosynthesis protein TsaE
MGQSLGPWLLPGAADTDRLGAAIAYSCPWRAPGPRLLFLSGELGAGKTTLAAAVLAALGVEEAVRSPSYALLETYELAAGLALHLDCYRLNDARELEQLGLRDYYHDRALWLVEWPERGGALLPAPELAVSLQIVDQGRRAGIAARSGVGAVWLERLLEPAVRSELKLDK